MCEEGLYERRYEHDACGVGMIVNMRGLKSHRIVEQGLQVLEHLVHRGAEGADPAVGDGAGIMVQIPHEFILLQGVPVPEKGRYGCGLTFFPKDADSTALMLDIIEREAMQLGLKLMAVRDVPVNREPLGQAALDAEPDIKQIFVSDEESEEPIELRLYLLRKIIERKVAESDIPGKEMFYIVSLSSKTIVYKGMLSSVQLRYYFPDLMNPRFTTAMALVHSRFSTNTMPEWKLAQPFRLIGHNGEINTIRGNRLWMKAREGVLNPPNFAGYDLTPIVQKNMSDSASLDNVLEYFVMAGMSLPHVLAMLVPESINEKNPISTKLKAFYEYHSILMEAWDGPATILFSDGRYAGGMLDRNGLRPGRYVVTKNGTVIIASEVGTLNIDEQEIEHKGRLAPGKMMMVDMKEHRILFDEEIKEQLADEFPYRDWLQRNRINLDNITSGRKVTQEVPDYQRMLNTFLYEPEEIERIMLPMITGKAEPIGSMGSDTPPAVFSQKPQLLFSYFSQHFAQVTNPSIDPLREQLVMSLDSYIGAVEGGLPQLTPELCKMVLLKRPIITNRELDLLCNLRYKGFNTRRLDITFPAKEGAEGLEKAIERVCLEAEKAVRKGENYVILSDRGVDAEHAPIPSLLATAAVHHHLIKNKMRTQTALVVETADAREIMHFALLVGYGASAVNPYLAFAVINDLVNKGAVQLDFNTASHNYISAIDKGLLKVMSKMGISTLTSYKGSELFEAYGLSKKLCGNYFGTTRTSISGIGLGRLTQDILRAHTTAFEGEECNQLPYAGKYSYRKDGEQHSWNPEAIKALQLALKLESYKKFKEFCELSDNKPVPCYIRDFFDFKQVTPIAIDEVEPIETIVKRFVTGAMSFGSISKEAHEAMAIVMNELGGRSNTGEGGEEAERFTPDADGVSRRSAIKQIASGRFGVTAEYLVNADELQIKISQGAKPGEGGQLPGFKVNEVIARTRHSIPKITLISPPPHHDIYSIEDLAQLIYDLQNVNPQAHISVKLVAESGVGTIAAGVAKAKADLITISGYDGGTGASPVSSIRYAGMPVELGLAETHQTLLLNGLRSQVKLQADGGLKTARDVVMLACLGADEFAFATAPLVALGCIMDRRCHTNKCPVGIATQDESLRAKFKGTVQGLKNYFLYMAQAVRELMAQLGVRCIDELVGRTDLIEIKEIVELPRYKGLDFSRLLYVPQVEEIVSPEKRITDLTQVLDQVIIAQATPAINFGMPVDLEFDINNTNRAVGAMLAGSIARKFGSAGLPENSINVKFKGSAGQSFGAFLPAGVNFELIGDANDYLGKGLSGGKITIVPPENAEYVASKNIIAGNTLLYGATSGEVYINGKVGERFCVRNSGATAVVEGVGDHGCEYMTGGRVVVLGKTGRNFAAGMSGGVAYIYDPDRTFDFFCNMELVELSLIEDKQDERELYALISAHYRHTRSSLAGKILNNWTESLPAFLKVMPIEYKKILQDS